MREKEIDGHVVHINSVLGHQAGKAMNVYCGSKHAVTALTETLRQELNALGSKIKITVRQKLIDDLATVFIYSCLECQSRFG